MQRFTEGDRVRIDIPDQDDPDHDRFHRKQGVVTGVLNDDAGDETGDIRDNVLYRIELADGTEMDFRWRDLRPAE
ncbi:hypothetical protein [Halomontanus rarus]|uniref:hypothetical protein n=1 Tax=Halomontanus rarus TaxID=3034020 RepID=UPI001A991AEE